MTSFRMLIGIKIKDVKKKNGTKRHSTRINSCSLSLKNLSGRRRGRKLHMLEASTEIEQR